MLNLQWPLPKEKVSKHIELTSCNIFMMLIIRICKFNLLYLIKKKNTRNNSCNKAVVDETVKMTKLVFTIVFILSKFDTLSHVFPSNLENKK